MARVPSGISAGISTGRLGGRVRVGSKAFHRKGFTQSARESMREINTRYTAIVRRLQNVTPDAVRQALQPVFEKSQEYVPVRTGRLKAIGQVQVEKEGSTRVRGTITYGSPSAWYAPIVHERMDLNHAAPTRAKFLQSAMEEEFDNFLATLAVFYAAEIK